MWASNQAVGWSRLVSYGYVCRPLLYSRAGVVHPTVTRPHGSLARVGEPPVSRFGLRILRDLYSDPETKGDFRRTTHPVIQCVNTVIWVYSV